MPILAGAYTIVVVTHNMAQARRIGDECAFMLLGDIVEHRRTEDTFIAPHDTSAAGYRTADRGAISRGRPLPFARDRWRLHVASRKFRRVVLRVTDTEGMMRFTYDPPGFDIRELLGA
ncbi:MAG: hypothetical protein HY899_19045 [Deltaproteobacteria bacterium]|nr:hypothetical protein [Deltaproteobacteria bacterium]